uniref:Uncharacterized protein n=1 Tax=Anguilla anguilla TaxID=7936 RepID=A0A0E9X6L1_ANGAN
MHLGLKTVLLKSTRLGVSFSFLRLKNVSNVSLLYPSILHLQFILQHKCQS